MTQLTREQLLNNLENDWGTYIKRFQKLFPEAQAAFLAQQGYARLGDLLGHVIAWWKEGLAAVRAMVANPDYVSPDYDVDSFNAQAVVAYSGIEDLAIIESFEETRNEWAELVKALPAEAFENQKIVSRLDLELIEHLVEHRLS